MPTSVATIADLTRILLHGGRVKFLFFWGHRPEPDGRIGPSCLSQWWPAPVTVEGVEFATAEHYMMWRKAMLFDDFATGDQILAAAHPGRAKALGRQIRGFDETHWQQNRFDIVVTGSTAKFSQHADLHRYLLNTKERVLVEASPRDRIWGIGLAADDERAGHPDQWRGLNLLGFALMRARAKLRDDNT